MVLKEEGDTSHLNQAYDQSAAKNDKARMRMNLDSICPHIGVRHDQWYLISIAIEALKKIKAAAWIESFTKVNLHPRHRVSFDVWLKKIDSTLSSGDASKISRKSRKNSTEYHAACLKVKLDTVAQQTLRRR
jgi:hypothetical protein